MIHTPAAALFSRPVPIPQGAVTRSVLEGEIDRLELDAKGEAVGDLVNALRKLGGDAVPMDFYNGVLLHECPAHERAE